MSDSIAATGESVIKAVASQFPNTDFNISRKPNLKSKSDVDAALSEAEKESTIIAYTLVDQNLLNYTREKTAELGLINVDLIAPIISLFQEVTGEEPVGEPGLNRKTDKIYFSKVDAIEFAVKFDDGKDPRSILKADIVIIGVSRTSKTPLCLYLANQGVKASNVPLVIQSPPPKELFKVDSNKIVGLTIRPEKLQEIRKQRLQIMGLPPSNDYTNMEQLLAEYEYATNLMRRLSCPIIDITNRSFEQTATKILEIYQKRKG